jgi:hypothetical protein
MNKYSLIDILSKEIIIEEHDTQKSYKFEGVQIPMIQRDYAQGREDEVEIRKRFLKSIFAALVSDSNLELDFIYGSMKEIDKKTHFIPLDGQQRLTTLFLLYWYIGKRELKEEEEKLEDLISSLKGFSYATRMSARDFCEKLIEVTISFKSTPKKEITNKAWFFSRFEKDPTVKAMLIMLDSIHLFYEQEFANNAKIQLFPSLSKLCFYILPLGGFNLSDELYIKMNARGKQLTDFENFKADLINWIRDEKNPFNSQFHNKVKLKGREMPYHLSFATKLDNNWTHLFWEYANEKGDDNIDVLYLRFWNRFLLNQHIIAISDKAELIEQSDIFKRLYGVEDKEVNLKYRGFDFYEKLFLKTDVILNAQKALDGLSENFNQIKNSIIPVWPVKESWNLFDEKINQPQRILFLAISLYFEKNIFDNYKFNNWIRVVWNIIVDPDIRSIPVMINIMRIINKLSEGSGDIYKFLIEPSLESIIQNESSFVKAQLEEEKLKAELIIADSNWEPLLISAEKHALFQGNIGFLLLGKPDIKIFQHRINIAEKLFTSNGPKETFSNKHLLLRAVISDIAIWDDLINFNFGDNTSNWKLLLRRNLNVKAFICNLCDLTDENTVIADLNTKIETSSTISEFSPGSNTLDKARNIHAKLYRDSDFFIWMQQNETLKLKWANDQLYIRKPSAWHKWVAIDGFRNELVTELISKFNLQVEQRCGDSNFYWGYHTKKIILSKQYNYFTAVVEFDEYGNLRIGVKDDGKSTIPKNVIIDNNDIENEWLIRKKYSYYNLINIIEVRNLIDQINDDVFDENRTGSVLNTIAQSEN